jgi:hypothetical protein
MGRYYGLDDFAIKWALGHLRPDDNLPAKRRKHHIGSRRGAILHDENNHLLQ